MTATILQFPKRDLQPSEDEHEARKHALTAPAFRLMRQVLADDLKFEATVQFGDAPHGS